MAITAFGTNDAQTVKLWSTMTLREALKKTMFKKFLGKGKDAIIMRLTELERQAGDNIKFDLLLQMGNQGVTGDNRLKGNEEALTYKQDNVSIDQLRNGHAFRRMSQQRTLHNLRLDAQMNLSDWFADRMDNIMFAHLCGDTSETFANTPVAPASTDEYLCSGDVSESGTISTDESSLGTNDRFALSDLDFAKEKARTKEAESSGGGVWIRPVRIDGGEYYVAVLHPYSVTDMRIDVQQTSYVSWPDVQMYANKRGLTNPIFTGALGVYNGVILYDSTRIYSPTSNVRRNLFLGAQAGVFAIGNAYGKRAQRKMGKDNLMSWYEEIDDYGNEEGIACGAVFGMKACMFDTDGDGTDEQLGHLVISSYSAAH